MSIMVHYEFKEERNGEMFTPWGNDRIYEMPFDFHFLTVKEAIETKKEHAPTEEWVLVKVTTEVLPENVVFPETKEN